MIIPEFVHPLLQLEKSFNIDVETYSVTCYLANFCPKVTQEQKEHVRTKKNRKKLQEKAFTFTREKAFIFILALRPGA